MVHPLSAHLPTVRQLLNADALSEAQILVGEELVDSRVVTQVVTSINPPPRSGSLFVGRIELLTGKESASAAALKDLSAVILIRTTAESSGIDSPPATIGSSAAARAAQPVSGAAHLAAQAELKRLAALCKEAEVPLIVMPNYGELGQASDEVRMSFLRQIKMIDSKLHASFMSLVIDQGLEGLVDEIAENLNRPVAIETTDFEVLASKNMAATPPAQQRTITDEAHQTIRRSRMSDRKSTAVGADHLFYLKVGRRLVLPILLGDAMVGYLSIMIRPNDEIEPLLDYLRPAALATMVDFNQRRKDGTVFAVTQKSLLKDLLSGYNLSAADQERLEQHYGFDLCDGLLVFAVEAIGGPGASSRLNLVADDSFISTEMEGTRVFIVPYHRKENRTWQQEAEELVRKLKEAFKKREGGAELKLQVGAGRLAETSLDLPDTYREARQALIVGSMVHGDNEFTLEYAGLGVKRLLYLVIDHPELDRFYEENLAPLEAYDEEWESELVPSLRVYLEQGANLNSAARALFIHRHTLRYRLEQIADILKVDIDSQEVLLNLQISFLIKDMKAGMKGNTRA